MKEDAQWLIVPFLTQLYKCLINQARGPYWENIGPRSWQYGPSAARSVQKDQGPISSQYGPEQAWLIRELLHDWKCLEEKPKW